ncbi:MAG TPA: hypothetical protein VEC37_10690, partial [Bacillota bacterium]|nr:hypothetical protein [Bacillota bacterium]
MPISNIAAAVADTIQQAKTNIYPIAGTVRCFETSPGVYEWGIVESDGSGGLGQVHGPINVTGVTTPASYEGRILYDH